jgi:hypothetical protein
MPNERTPRNKIVGAFGVLDARWKSSNVRTKKAADAPSDYTEAGPRAGAAVPIQTTGLVLKTAGGQTADGAIRIRAQEGGLPLPGEGSMLWQEGSDESYEWQGADGYQAVTGWEGLVHSTSGLGLLGRPAVVRLHSGELLAHEASNESTQNFRVYDPKDGGWTVRASISVAALNAGQALLQLPSARVLWFYVVPDADQISVQFSDDDGATWAPYRSGILGSATVEPITDIAVGFSRGVISIITSEEVTTGGLRAEQWISRDLGNTAQLVGSEWNSSNSNLPNFISIAPTPSGKFVVLFLDEAGTATYRSFSYDAAQPAFLGGVGIATVTQLNSLDEAACVVWADEDGTLYALLSVGGASTTDQRVALRRSEDQGAKFRDYEAGAIDLNQSGTENLVSWACASTGGRTAWLTRWTSSGSTSNRSLGVIWLGGSADHTFPSAVRAAGATSPARFSVRNYLGFSRAHNGSSLARMFGVAWVPISLPDAGPWALSSPSSATVALASPGVLNIQGAVTERTSYYLADTNGQGQASTVGAVEGFYAAWMLDVQSGGSLDTTQIGVDIRVTDYDQQTTTNSTWDHGLVFQFTTTDLRIRDIVGAATVGGDISHDFTKPTWVAVAIRGVAGGSGEVAVWVGDPLAPKRVFPLARAGSSLATRPPGVWQSRIEFGCIAAAGGDFDCNWHFMGGTVRIREFSLRDAVNWVSGWGNPADVRGRDWSQVPALLFDDVRLSAEGGPAKSADEWTIETEYAFPISNLFPLESPSPRRTWRSVADNVDQTIVLDFEDDSVFTASRLLSHSICLAVLNSNVREIQLRVQSGAGAWTTIATFSPRESGLSWERRGRVVRPDPGQTDEASIYFLRAQHVGDTMDLDAGEGTELHKIEVNRPGAWNTDGSGTPPQQLPEFVLSADNLDASTPTSGTSADIWFRDWAGIVHEYDRDDHRFALFIPAHRTADGYYEIGTVLLGDLLLLAHRFDRGYTVVRTKNLDVFTRADGLTRTRRRGPQVRQFEFSFSATAIPARNVQKATPAPDWISMREGGGGLPVGTPEGVIRDLEGMLEESDGAHVPVVYLHKLPQAVDPATTSIVSLRRDITYGRLGTAPLTETPWARRGPGEDEVERLQALLLTELT